MEKTALSGTYLRTGKSTTRDVRYDTGCSIGMCAGLLRRVKPAHRSIGSTAYRQWSTPTRQVGTPDGHERCLHVFATEEWTTKQTPFCEDDCPISNTSARGEDGLVRFHVCPSLTMAPGPRTRSQNL